MKLRLRTKLISATLLLLLMVLSYLLLFGKLFAFSPIIIGFTEHELPDTRIYVQDNSDFADLQRIDNLLGPVETWHGLEFVEKPRIFIFGDSASYHRRTTTRARLCAYPNGSVVISPWAVAEDNGGTISLDVYLTHELSHTLLYQHMGVISAYRFPEWLMEGIAVYSSNQMGTSWYPTRDEVYTAIGRGVFFPPHLYKTDKEDDVELDIENRIAFMYSEFACVVDRMIELYGKDRFMEYVGYLLRGDDHDRAFMQVFGTEFDDFIAAFRTGIENSKSQT